MAMAALNTTVLIVSMRTSLTIRDASSVEKTLEWNKLSPTVGLDAFNGVGEEIFNDAFEFDKKGSNIRLTCHRKEPNIFAKIINHTKKVMVTIG
jgi:hypothetical protein